MRDVPGRNIYKDYVADSYYHVYNRGVNKQQIFRDKADYVVFLSLLKRYLGSEESMTLGGRIHPSFKNEVEVLAFCLLPTHFHLLIYQHDQETIKLFLKSLSVSYAMYFNKKYKRKGPVFEQRYRASRISDDSYLLHISRYLHLNPDDYLNWRWSSLPYFLSKKRADWLKPKRLLSMFEGENYLEFLKDYKDQRNELEIIKHELADQ